MGQGLKILGEPSLLRGYKWKCVGMVPPIHSGGVRSVVPTGKCTRPREKRSRRGLIGSVRLTSPLEARVASVISAA